MYVDKCISGEMVDNVLSNVAREYPKLAGYEIVMNQWSVCVRFMKILQLGLRPRVSGFINHTQS